VRFDAGSALSLGLLDHVLEDLDHSDDYGLVLGGGGVLDDLHAFGYQVILDRDSLRVKVSVEVVVDFDQEFDGFGDHGRVLTLQSDVPHNFELVQGLRG